MTTIKGTKRKMSLFKLRAFLSQGLAIAMSYKLNFVTRYLSMFVSLILYYFLDQLFQLNGTNNFDGISYFSFVLVGGAYIRFMELSLRTFALNIREEMLMGTIEPVLVTSTPAVFALLGPSTWGLIEGAIIMVMQLFMGALIGADFSNANWLAGSIIILLSLTSIVSYGIFSAAFTIIFKQGDPINWTMRSVGQVFSGVFFPVALLPPWLRVISYLLPFTYALNGLRGALLQGKTVVELRTDVLALVAFTVILIPLSALTMRYAIRYLRRTGELSHY